MFIHLFDMFTLYGLMVVVGLCVVMLRLYLSWMICCNLGANVCSRGGISRLSTHIRCIHGWGITFGCSTVKGLN